MIKVKDHREHFKMSYGLANSIKEYSNSNTE